MQGARCPFADVGDVKSLHEAALLRCGIYQRELNAQKDKKKRGNTISRLRPSCVAPGFVAVPVGTVLYAVFYGRIIPYVVPFVNSYYANLKIYFLFVFGCCETGMRLYRPREQRIID